MQRLSVLTKYFKIGNSSVDKLTIGKSHIKKIELQNEVIGKCSIVDESIDSDEIDKWILVRKSALQKRDRIQYVNASYMINKKYFKLEKKWLRKLLLNVFSIICGYGYKPLRTIASSLFFIVFWGIIYWIFGQLLLDSFYRDISIYPKTISFIDYIYYSGITYTTIGYGDIVPLNDVIKVLSILEALTGVSMLSLFIFSLTKSLTEHIQGS